MKRRYLVAAAAAFTFVLGACNSGTGGGPSASAGDGAAVTLTVSHTSAGDALAGSNGKTLYTNNKEQDGTIACTGDCAAAWPPLTGTVTASGGVTGTLGTVTRPDGSEQATYNGSPLYYYVSDAAAGDATGQGKGGVWYIALPSGAASSPAASASAPPRPGY